MKDIRGPQSRHRYTRLFWPARTAKSSMSHCQVFLSFSGLVFSGVVSLWPHASTARLLRDTAGSKACRPRGAQKPGHHRVWRGNEQPLRSELIKHFNLLSLIVLWWLPWTGYQESWVLFLMRFSNEKEIVFRRGIEAHAPRDVRYAAIRLKLNNKSSNTEPLALAEHHYV